MYMLSVCFLCGSLCGLLLAALCGPLCGGPLLCGPFVWVALAAFRSSFCLRHSFSACRPPPPLRCSRTYIQYIDIDIDKKTGNSQCNSSARWGRCNTRVRVHTCIYGYTCYYYVCSIHCYDGRWLCLFGSTWPSSPETSVPRDSAFTRDSFSSRPVYKNQYYYSQTPSLFGHPPPPLHHLHDCGIHRFPPTILHCNACHTVLVTAISFKDQRTIDDKFTPTNYLTPSSPPKAAAAPQLRVNTGTEMGGNRSCGAAVARVNTQTEMILYWKGDMVCRVNPKRKGGDAQSIMSLPSG